MMVSLSVVMFLLAAWNATYFLGYLYILLSILISLENVFLLGRSKLFYKKKNHNLTNKFQTRPLYRKIRKFGRTILLLHFQTWYGILSLNNAKFSNKMYLVIVSNAKLGPLRQNINEASAAVGTLMEFSMLYKPFSSLYILNLTEKYREFYIHKPISKRAKFKRDIKEKNYASFSLMRRFGQTR